MTGNAHSTPAEIIPFDFEEQAVRVVMRGDDPWFVAADICRVLEIQNTTDAVKRLDEDEVTLDQIEGSHRPTNLVSESGLYALVIRSDKPAAKRFRKWITAVVIPSIRRTGRYVHPGLPQAEPQDGFDGLEDPMSPRDWLALVREARLLGGVAAGRRMWARSPLPPLNPILIAAVDPEDGRACLDHVLGFGAPPVADRIAAALAGDLDAYRALAMIGLRPREDGLFIAHSRVAGLAQLFARSRWSDGRHRAALLAIPAARLDQCTLLGVVARGVVVPLSEGEA